MAKMLTQYNTLTEALAFNQTKDEAKEFGYYETMHTKTIMETNLKMFHILDPKYIFYRYGQSPVSGLWGYMPSSTYDSSTGQATGTSTETAFAVEFMNTEPSGTFQPLYKAIPFPKATYGTSAKGNMREIIGSGTDTIEDRLNWGIVKSGVLSTYDRDYSLNICLVYTQNYFGDWGQTDRPKDSSGHYTTNNFTNNVREQREIIMKSRYKQNGYNTFDFFPFTDFRWLENKKIFLWSDITDGVAKSLGNLIPEGSIFFICSDENVKTRLEAELPTLKDDCTGTLDIYQDTIKRITGVTSIWADGFYTNLLVGFRSEGNIFVFYPTMGINSLFCNDGGEAYPLNKNGYIDFSAIDYRKKYTKGVGAACLHPRTVAKTDALYYIYADQFTNKPTPEQGSPFSITLSQQTYKTNSNSGTLTITLGYTTIDAVTYNDELTSVTSSKSLINIVNNGNNTYTISFKSTTSEQDDVLTVEIKNTFTNIYSYVSYNLKCVYEPTNPNPDYIRVYPSAITTTVAKNANETKGYVYFYRSAGFTADEQSYMTSANETDLPVRLQKYFTTTKAATPATRVADPVLFSSVKFNGNNEMLVYFKGETYNAILDIGKWGTYTYTHTIAGTSKTATFTLLMHADSNWKPSPVPDPGPGPGDGDDGGGGGGGGGGGNTGGGGGSNNNGNGGWMRDDGNIDSNVIQPKYEAPLVCTPLETDADGWGLLSSAYDLTCVCITSTEPAYDPNNPPKPVGAYGGGVLFAKDYQGGYAWYLDTVGQFFTNKHNLMPQNRNTYIIKAKRKNDPEAEWVTILTWFTETPVQPYVYVGDETTYDINQETGMIDLNTWTQPEISQVPSITLDIPALSGLNGFTPGNAEFSGIGDGAGGAGNLNGYKVRVVSDKWAKSGGWYDTYGSIPLPDGSSICIVYPGCETLDNYLSIYKDPFSADDWKLLSLTAEGLNKNGDTDIYNNGVVTENMVDVLDDQGNATGAKKFDGSYTFDDSKYLSLTFDKQSTKQYSDGSYTADLVVVDYAGNTRTYQNWNFSISTNSNSKYITMTDGNYKTLNKYTYVDNNVSGTFNPKNVFSISTNVNSYDGGKLGWTSKDKQLIKDESYGRQ